MVIFLRRSGIRSAVLAALLACSPCVPSSAQPGPETGSSRSCASSQGGSGVSISSCVYTLSASPAGNLNYYVNVTIAYAPSGQGGAIRFRCDLSNGDKPVSQYGVSRSSPAELKFISPFVTSARALSSVACAVDEVSGSP